MNADRSAGTRLAPTPDTPMPAPGGCLTIVVMRFSLILLLLTRAACAADPEVFLLWPEGAPGSAGKTSEESVRIAQPGGDHVVSNVHKPSITVYIPPKETATGAGVIVMLGGGQSALWMDHEG